MDSIEWKQWQKLWHLYKWTIDEMRENGSVEMVLWVERSIWMKIERIIQGYKLEWFEVVLHLELNGNVDRERERERYYVCWEAIHSNFKCKLKTKNNTIGKKQTQIRQK